MGYTVELNTNGPVKRIKTFITPDGKVFQGSYEDYLRQTVNLGGAGQADSVSTGTGPSNEPTK
jgi:hypothetical protein